MVGLDKFGYSIYPDFTKKNRQAFEYIDFKLGDFKVKYGYDQVGIQLKNNEAVNMYCRDECNLDQTLYKAGVHTMTKDSFSEITAS